MRKSLPGWRHFRHVFPRVRVQIIFINQGDIIKVTSTQEHYLVVAKKSIIWNNDNNLYHCYFGFQFQVLDRHFLFLLDYILCLAVKKSENIRNTEKYEVQNLFYISVFYKAKNKK